MSRERRGAGESSCARNSIERFMNENPRTCRVYVCICICTLPPFVVMPATVICDLPRKYIDRMFYETVRLDRYREARCIAWKICLRIPGSRPLSRTPSSRRKTGWSRFFSKRKTSPFCPYFLKFSNYLFAVEREPRGNRIEND